MSAVFGLVRFNGGEVVRPELESIADALRAYGGDGVGIWIDKNVGLGCRLRFICPEDRFEQQPLVDAHSGNVVLFGGRLDNRTELRDELGPLAGAWSETPDSAVASEAFRRWGPECANRLLGDYVMVVWDTREQQVLIIRTPLSGRTLFYYLHGGLLAFASSPVGLFALPFVPRELDRERLADYAVRASSDPSRSFFREIGMVEGGTVATIDRTGIRTRAFWCPGSLPEIRFKTDDEYVEGLVERFDRAVSARLRSSFPLAAMMSGGIDSSAVACTAAAELARESRRLFAFTQVPREPSDEVVDEYYTDERSLVQSIPRRYPNIDLQLVPTGHECMIDGHDEFVAAGGAPFRNMGNRHWMEAILGQAARLGARAVLTGASGNIAFSWSGKGVLAGMIQRGQLLNAWRHARSLNGTSTLRTFIGHGIAPFLPDRLWLAVMRSARPDDVMLQSNPPWRAISPLRREFEQAQRVRARARSNGCDLLGRPDRDSLGARISLFKWGQIAGPEIANGFEARHGIELRDPTSDRRVVDFCLSIPEELFQRNGEPRSLPRRAMADRWPAEIAANRRRGMQNSDWRPLFMETRPQLGACLDRITASPLAVEILDIDRMRVILDAADTARADSRQYSTDVRNVLYFGLGLGQFFQWIESPR